MRHITNLRLLAGQPNSFPKPEGSYNLLNLSIWNATIHAYQVWLSVINPFIRFWQQQAGCDNPTYWKVLESVLPTCWCGPVLLTFTKRWQSLAISTLLKCIHPTNLNCRSSLEKWGDPWEQMPFQNTVHSELSYRCRFKVLDNILVAADCLSIP